MENICRKKSGIFVVPYNANVVKAEGNERMKKVLTILCVGLCLCFTGCSTVQQIMEDMNSGERRVSEEERLYNEAVDSFFAALDAGDGEAIKNMFSEQVQREDKDLEEQIELLLHTYSGPIDVNKRNGASVAASYSNDYGVHTSEAYDTFPVVSGDTYYWCRFSLMYENDEDASEIGVTQVLFFTAESYCECRYTDGWKYPSERGLTVFAENSLDCEVRAIQGNPRKYEETGNGPDLEAAVQFLEENNSYSAFVEHFGEPNAVDIYHFYGLPLEGGEPRYLVLSVTEKTDSIQSASVADDLEWLETVWEKEE